MERQIHEEPQGGMELRVSNIQFYMPWSALKTELLRHMGHVDYNFLVVLENSAEQYFWESFDGHHPSQGTARVIIPNDENGTNPGEVLIDRKVLIEINGHRFELQVTRILNPETTNNKFEELRSSPLNIDGTLGLPDGVLGQIYRVSCGNFDQENRFETYYSWQKKPGDGFDTFSYFGDVWPPKFQVPMEEAGPGEPLKWEWMDLYVSNVRGVLFEDPLRGAQQRDRRVVYFVTNKPPQFYQRVEGRTPLFAGGGPSGVEDIGNDRLGNNRTAYRYSRTTHPSVRLEPVTLESECGSIVPCFDYFCEIPWVIQFSRVYRIEYFPQADFSIQAYSLRLKASERENLFSFHCPGIERSGRSREDMIKTLTKTMIMLNDCHLTFHKECRLAMLTLLYNGNISATESSILFGSFMYDRYDLGIGGEAAVEARRFCEDVKSIAKLMGASHVRVLQRLHALLEPGTPRIPQDPPEPLIDPVEAVENTCQRYWKFSKPPQNWGDAPPGIFEILIYPSHVELRGPVMPSLNSVTEKYLNLIESFLRVRFVDNTDKPLKIEPGIDYESIIEDRVVRVLKNSNLPLLQIHSELEFIGYSMSSLKKKRAVWFIDVKDSRINAKTIRDQIGAWDDTNKTLATKPSKWGARMSSAFTEAHATVVLTPPRCAKRADVGAINDFPNTDGCGIIDSDLCDEINECLALYGYAGSQAFQIRFGGAKGVVYSGAKSLFNGHQNAERKVQLLLRESQLKFQVPESDELTLRVVSTAGDGHVCLFSPAVLKAFEDFGASTLQIEEHYRLRYQSLANAPSSESLYLLRQMYRIPDDSRDAGLKGRDCLLKLAIRLERDGVNPPSYQNSFLALYLTKLAEKRWEKNMFEIPIPGSYFVLGLTDDYQVLEHEQVYIRAQGRTIHGQVLIYRDPIIHIGDIQEATALDDTEVRHRLNKYPDGKDRFCALQKMNGVVFFSQLDTPPFPNRLSGGDLDGDRFEVVLKQDWLKEYKKSNPANYVEGDGNQVEEHKSSIVEDAGALASAANDRNDFAIEKLAEFIGQYIHNDCFAELQDLLLCLADQKPGGMKHLDVKALAEWLSKAVDYAKSGEGVDLNQTIALDERFQATGKPDFLRATNRKTKHDLIGAYYQSRSILGKLYRTHRQKEYIVPKVISNEGLQRVVAAAPVLTPTQHPDLEAQQKMDNQMDEVFHSEFASYREYLRRRDIPLDSEVDVFLQKQPDIFPDQIISSLAHQVMRVLWDSGYIDEPYEERLFSFYIFQAWETTLQLANVAENGFPTGFGQSYAFLCLFAFYFRKPPVSKKQKDWGYFSGTSGWSYAQRLLVKGNEGRPEKE